MFTLALMRRTVLVSIPNSAQRHDVWEEDDAGGGSGIGLLSGSPALLALRGRQALTVTSA